MKQHKLDRTLPHSIVFYDHSCGLCRNEMIKLKKRDYLERLYLVDVSSPQFDAKLWGVTRSAALEQLHVRTPAGVWLTGIPGVRHVYNEVGLGWLWWSTKLPMVGYVSQRLYNWFARNRMAISKGMGMYAGDSGCETCPSKTTSKKGA